LEYPPSLSQSAMRFGTVPGRIPFEAVPERAILVGPGRSMSLDAYSSARNRPLHISVVALPESILSPLIGLYEVFDVMRIYASCDEAFPKTPCFRTEIVAPAPDLPSLTSDLPLRAHRTIAQIDHTDIIIVPSKTVQDGEWVCGRYPELVEWIRRMHAAGAELCSACSGALLLGETGLWNGRAATIHWLFAPIFARNFPKVSCACAKCSSLRAVAAS
jgi:transcriptional regulator GlxA family with amidase domain